MNILIATFTYPPNADGVAEHAAVLARGLVARGHKVTIATAFHPGRKPDPPDANPQVVQFRISGYGNWRVGIQSEPGEREAYQKFLQNFSGDLAVFSCWDMWPMYLARPILERMTAKKVLVSHGYTAHLWIRYPKFPWGLGYWIGGWPLVLTMSRDLRKFDHVVFLSRRADRDRFFDHWMARMTGFRNCSVIPNGARASEFNGASADFRTEFGVGPGPLLLYVANYGDRKNQLMALRAFRKAQLAGATLVLIGSEFNEYSSDLQRHDEALRRSYPAGKLLLLEKLTRAQTCAAFKAADLFVLSAKAETQPIVLLEAMASHTPFISTDVGCVSELPGGIVVRSEEEMARQIQALIAAPERRRQIADEGRAACGKTYDWEQVVGAYEQLFNKLISGQ